MGIVKRGDVDVWGIAHGSMNATEAAEVKVPGHAPGRRRLALAFARLPAL